MRLIRPDARRTISLPGVAQPVPRPVDIDNAQTGFRILRTLRIYRFQPGTQIEGHAEEDEVFIVVLQGEIELEMRAHGSADCRTTLAAPAHAPDGIACAAYLPLRGEYLLTAQTDADVAYARATPKEARPAASFTPDALGDSPAGLRVILDLRSPAERLRVQIIRAPECGGISRAELFEGGVCPGEALLHVRTDEAGGPFAVIVNGHRQTLQSWDTVAIGPGERAALDGDPGSNFTALLVWGE
ncbi:MAG: 5-deoxy-glucuronate isomerase [Sinobacteraceae bacterium]|nr:5-deoxy-glucuronate isomerase [Nevskiaceae bacterium]